MTDHNSRIQKLEFQIATLESQLQALRVDLAHARDNVSVSGSSEHSMPDAQTSPSTMQDEFLAGALDGGFPDDWRTDVLAALGHSPEESPNKWPLSQEEYKRYGRQLIMPEVGLQGQLRLKAAMVLVVGAGGLGCPALAYLAGAGVGTLGVVDGDTVEESNLHRQILHNTGRVGRGKVESAVEGLKELNPLVHVISYNTRLEPQNALEIFASYDLVLDCTDTPASRYLISDTCVLLGKPLVSASALRTEGQLMILNYPARPAGDPGGGPCYRCVFPKPPPVESVVSCGDGGILGPVVGVMGVLQALEAIKIITAGGLAKDVPLGGDTVASSFAETALDPPGLLLFSGYSTPQFRSIKLRSRKLNCAACSSQAVITADVLASRSMDYVQFCGIANPINILSPSERISALEYAEQRKNISLSGRQHQIIDVREKVQFDLCHLFGSINIPFSQITALSHPSQPGTQSNSGVIVQLQQMRSRLQTSPSDPVYVVCRLGNDSQIAVKKFKELGLDNGGRSWVGDIKGGLRAWREDVDRSFPEY